MRISKRRVSPARKWFALSVNVVPTGPVVGRKTIDGTAAVVVVGPVVVVEAGLVAWWPPQATSARTTNVEANRRMKGPRATGTRSAGLVIFAVFEISFFYNVGVAAHPPLSDGLRAPPLVRRRLVDALAFGVSMSAAATRSRDATPVAGS